jgi:hypothetical protein
MSAIAAYVVVNQRFDGAMPNQVDTCLIAAVTAGF